MVFFLLFFSFQLIAQKELYWERDVLLSWSDYKGEVDFKSKSAAASATGISYTFSTYYLNDSLQVDYTVNTVFYPQQSWYNPYDFPTVTVGHEQLHFDITELFARKFRKELDKTVFTENVKEEIQSIYIKISKELDAFQKLYEKETGSSLKNGASQKSWNLRVKKALDDYEDIR